MNRQEIEIIKKRVDLAPKGEWVLVSSDDGSEVLKLGDHYLYLGDLESTDKCCYDLADFILNSIKDVPTLIDELEKLRRVLHELAFHASKAHHEELRNHLTRAAKNNDVNLVSLYGISDLKSEEWK